MLTQIRSQAAGGLEVVVRRRYGFAGKALICDWHRQLRAQQLLLRPEAVLCLLVPLEFAELSDFRVHKPPNIYLRECCRLAVTLRLDGHERDHHIVFGKDMMNLNAEDAAGKFYGVFEKSDDLVVAFVITRQRTVTRHMPSD